MGGRKSRWIIKQLPDVTTSKRFTDFSTPPGKVHDYVTLWPSVFPTCSLLLLQVAKFTRFITLLIENEAKQTSLSSFPAILALLWCGEPKWYFVGEFLLPVTHVGIWNHYCRNLGKIPCTATLLEEKPSLYWPKNNKFFNKKGNYRLAHQKILIFLFSYQYLLHKYNDVACWEKDLSGLQTEWNKVFKHIFSYKL